MLEILRDPAEQLLALCAQFGDRKIAELLPHHALPRFIQTIPSYLLPGTWYHVLAVAEIIST
jgi:hypothetical protein